jgi:hypothetical protein
MCCQQANFHLVLLQVTAIFYLNQHWKPSHGGQLRLYPFPAPPVDIQPLQDRLVLFATTRMLHRCGDCGTAQHLSTGAACLQEDTDSVMLWSSGVP